MEEQVKQLIELFEKSQRSEKRQAAPFRKKKKNNPKKPGRKPGDDDGTQAFRKAPSPEEITSQQKEPALTKSVSWTTTCQLLHAACSEISADSDEPFLSFDARPTRQ